MVRVALINAAVLGAAVLGALAGTGCGRIAFEPREDGAAADGVPRTCAAAGRQGASTGVTLVDPDGAGPTAARQVWCDQDRAGGGWALALKIDGAAPTFRADSALWGDGTLLAATSLDPATPDEAKLAPYLDDVVAEVLLVIEGTGEVVIPLRGPSLRALLAGVLPVPTQLAPATWRAAFGAPSLEAGCQRQGAALTGGAGDVRGRLGVLAASAAGDCADPTSFVGIGNAVACAGGGVIAAGNVAGPGADGGEACAPARVRVYVRGDHTDVAAAASCLAHRDLGRLDDGVYLIGAPPVARRCDMTIEGGGWTSALSLDTTVDACPPGWQRQVDAPLCEVAAGETVAALTVSSPSGPYSAVMVATVAYQVGASDGFDASSIPSPSIDEPYLDGLAVSVGSPRRHIASFAAGYSETISCGSPGVCQCPCLGGRAAPAFATGATRCEAGALGPPPGSAPLLVRRDPLFDTAETAPGCEAEASATPIRTGLPAATVEALEVRLLRDEPNQDEGLAVQRVDVWVR